MVRAAGDRGGHGRGDGGAEARIPEGRRRGAEATRARARRAGSRKAEAAHDVRSEIRRYRDSDHAAVRALFISINRELATPSLREAFESYVAVSLRDEIDRLAHYYAERRG